MLSISLTRQPKSQIMTNYCLVPTFDHELYFQGLSMMTFWSIEKKTGTACFGCFTARTRLDRLHDNARGISTSLKYIVFNKWTLELNPRSMYLLLMISYLCNSM